MRWIQTQLADGEGLHGHFIESSANVTPMRDLALQQPLGEW
jgi:hypothetical protein